MLDYLCKSVFFNEKQKQNQDQPLTRLNTAITELQDKIIPDLEDAIRQSEKHHKKFAESIKQSEQTLEDMLRVQEHQLTTMETFVKEHNFKNVNTDPDYRMGIKVAYKICDAIQQLRSDLKVCQTKYDSISRKIERGKKTLQDKRQELESLQRQRLALKIIEVINGIGECGCVLPPSA